MLTAMFAMESARIANFYPDGYGGLQTLEKLFTNLCNSLVFQTLRATLNFN